MSNTIGDLLDTPPQELLEERERVRRQLEALERESDLIDRVIEMVMEAGGPAAEWFDDPSRPFVAVGSLRWQIARLINTSDPQPWSPSDVLDRLATSGNKKATLDNVRVTMRRMATNDELIQPQPQLLMFFPLKGAEAMLAEMEEEGSPNGDG
jgi:hypothetical protein